MGVLLFQTADRRGIEFAGNDFRDANLVDVGFRLGVDLTKQKLPTGDQYFYIDQVSGFLEDL